MLKHYPIVKFDFKNVFNYIYNYLLVKRIMIFTPIVILPIIITIIKDRKEYFKWQKNYEIK